jgi:hypothetical protein
MEQLSENHVPPMEGQDRQLWVDSNTTKTTKSSSRTHSNFKEYFKRFDWRYYEKNDEK